jgi:hypothetical protein
VTLAVIHHVNDDEDPLGVVGAYKERLAPGRHVFLSHFCNSFPEARAIEALPQSTLGRWRMRSLEEITAFFDGFELLEPGVVRPPRRRPEKPAREPLDASGLLLAGGMAREP